MECQPDENHCDVPVNDEPNRIEVTITEYVPARASICRTWDKCKHLRSDEFNQQFLADHPECR